MNKYKPFFRKANYYETDKMGIIHHSNYIRWFEEARIDFLEQAGFPYERMEQLGLQIPVLSASCTYKNAVRFNDTVCIKMRVEEFNGFKFTISYNVTDKESGELCATGETSHFFVDSELKPVRTKNKFPDIYHVFFDILQQDIY